MADYSSLEDLIPQLLSQPSKHSHDVQPSSVLTNALINILSPTLRSPKDRLRSDMDGPTPPQIIAVSKSNRSSSSDLILTTPRVSSPLNPGTTPTSHTISLQESDESNTPPNFLMPRGRTISSSTTPKHVPGRLGLPSSSRSEGSALSLPEYFGEELHSTFRERSQSPRRGSSDDQNGLLSPLHITEFPDHKGLSSSWWGDKPASDVWHEPKKRKKTLSEEHHKALEGTRKRVARSTAAILGTAADVAHEALYIGVELLDLAPVPGLASAAKTLLNIWDACQLVDMNFLGSLRLTERCADILLSVREEVALAGDKVEQQLAAPIAKLEDSFIAVLQFLQKQNSRPFLKRYLKRDEIQRDLANCDISLRDALALFGISIQIRILKQVIDTERLRPPEAQASIKAIAAGEPPPPAIVDPELLTTEEPTSPTSPYMSETVTRFSTTGNALGLTEEPVELPSHAVAPADIIPTLEMLQLKQNSLDATRDLDDLRKLMRTAVQAGSDAQMIEVLQIGRHEMPDAIKTLQRALERIADGDMEGVEAPPPKGVVVGKVVRRVSVRRNTEGPEPGTRPARSMTVISVESSDSSSNSGTGSSEGRRRDTLDFEFIETGIDALRRMSRGVNTSVPAWTITKYEIDRDEKIGIGFFSDVYKGRWRGKIVAIKVLAESTPQRLFVREMGIWKTLRHQNVLELYGASSASGDPPWFFVSPYLKHGNLVEYLKHVEHDLRPSGLGVGVSASQSHGSPVPGGGGGRTGAMPLPWIGNGSLGRNEGSPIRPHMAHPRYSDSEPTRKEWDLFRFMHEIAKGMAYLHKRGVLHGDLKATNVLVDDNYHCVLSDFGLSEMKSEAFRISGTPLPHGTLRWQSPELMSGTSNLTAAIDVWAFSICCVEILTMGRLPWPLMDDEAVRRFVIHDDNRPPLPENSRFNTPGFQTILRACWNRDPQHRPTFVKIVRDFKLLRKATTGQDVTDSPQIQSIKELSEPVAHSPDMRPTIPLPAYLQGVEKPPLGPHDSTNILYPAWGETSSHSEPLHETAVSSGPMKMPVPVIYTPTPSSSRSSTASITKPPVHPEELIYMLDSDGGHDSPPPIDERAANARNERRYRLLLTHEHHSSLTLPLWEPSPVDLGAVGYLAKPQGHFVTLFNSLAPLKADHPSIKQLPSIHGYGPAEILSHRQERRSVAQRGLDTISGWINFGTSTQNVARRIEFPLKSGHKVAYMYAETTDYRYFLTLDAAKKWFKQHIDIILETYGYQHHLQKEDVFVVVGTLRTPNYGLFVSHSHPEGHAHFNVYSSPKNGHPWGTFTTSVETPRELGPLDGDDDDIEEGNTASKVSRQGSGPWDAVLLARIRFKPDSLEPTSK